MEDETAGQPIKKGQCKIRELTDITLVKSL